MATRRQAQTMAHKILGPRAFVDGQPAELGAFLAWVARGPAGDGPTIAHVKGGSASDAWDRLIEAMEEKA